jgi:hypothetical protein
MWEIENEPSKTCQTLGHLERPAVHQKRIGTKKYNYKNGKELESISSN